jgi:hypothetical protein
VRELFPRGAQRAVSSPICVCVHVCARARARVVCVCVCVCTRQRHFRPSRLNKPPWFHGEVSARARARHLRDARVVRQRESGSLRKGAKTARTTLTRPRYR